MKKYFCISFLFIILITNSINVSASSKINKIDILYGKTYAIKTTKNMKWVSNNTSVATVNSKGKIKAVGYGSAKIICKNKNGNKKIYNVTVKNYIVKKSNNRKYPNIITVYMNKKYITYRVYNQTGFNSSYLNQRGCSHTSASIVMSAYNKKYTPIDIHNGSTTKKCSERYALKKLGKRVAVTGQSLGVYSVSQIIKNSGIKCHPVYKFKKSSAIKEITNNLNIGKPVLIMCHRKTVNGIKLANSYHFLVLVGIDQDGYAIVLNPAGGTVNRSHCTGDFKLTVSQLVKNHMWSCTGSKYKSFYFNGAENYGGYIVIDE